MIQNYTLARPYAKAIFALAIAHRNFDEWSRFLEIGKKIIAELKNAHVILLYLSRKQRLDILKNISETFMFAPQENFTRLLIKRRKLYLLPQISELYEELYRDYEKKMQVAVHTAQPLTAEQQKNLTLALSNKSSREIILRVNVDAELIGGAVIYLGDRVIDGSIVGVLQRMRRNFKL